MSVSFEYHVGRRGRGSKKHCGVEAVEASGHKELTAKEQAEAEYAEPEEKLIEETVPEMFEHTEEFAQNKAEAEYIEPEEPVEAEYIQTEEPVEAEYIQPEEPVEAEYIQPEESVEAEYIQPEKEADMSMPDTEGFERSRYDDRRIIRNS